MGLPTKSAERQLRLDAGLQRQCKGTGATLKQYERAGYGGTPREGESWGMTPLTGGTYNEIKDLLRAKQGSWPKGIRRGEAIWSIPEL